MTERLAPLPIQFRPSCSRLLLEGTLVLLLGGGATLTAAPHPREVSSPAPVSSSSLSRLQGLVDELRSRLDLQHEVTVALVPRNPLLVSVESAGSDGAAFSLAFEEGFLQELSDEDVTAIVAHELGHVWIFTHHPYLQTEKLANRIAMRIVTRESLQRVYEKVWQRKGIKGPLDRFIGE
jgi:hypothetical protein